MQDVYFSYSLLYLNYQLITSGELMTEDEIAVMDGGKCILQIWGARRFFSDKYDITKHPNYQFLSDTNQKNWYEIEKEINPQYMPKPDEVVDIAIDLKSSNITFSTSAAAITDYTHSTILTSFTEIRHMNSIRCYRISPVIRQTPLYRFSPIT